MISIEQRAHDLAVSYATEHLKANNSKFEFDKIVLFDYAKDYIHCYRAILPSLEEEVGHGI